MTLIEELKTLADPASPTVDAHLRSESGDLFVSADALRRLIAEYEAPAQEAVDPASIEAEAIMNAGLHEPDHARLCCTCGFGVWSVAHVVAMSVRAALARPAQAAPADRAVEGP